MSELFKEQPPCVLEGIIAIAHEDESTLEAVVAAIGGLPKHMVELTCYRAGCILVVDESCIRNPMACNDVRESIRNE